MKLLIFLLLVAVVLSKTTCGGNCPSGQCGGCPCGVDANPVDITVWCAKYSWSQACCRCIVSHESGGNANAINFSLQTYYSAGLWQINEQLWTSCSGVSGVPCDPSDNLKCAISVYNYSGDWSAWYSHTACGC